jgi:metal-responsive CopG/Arc/MetJ family transcriptional regulator
MQQITVKISDETADTLTTVATDTFDGNRSEAIRELLERGIAYDDLETENERLQRRVQTLIEQREEHGELVEYVEAERELQRQERERRNANAIERAKWWLLGRE